MPYRPARSQRHFLLGKDEVGIGARAVVRDDLLAAMAHAKYESAHTLL
jgi:hypothetical protein